MFRSSVNCHRNSDVDARIAYVAVSRAKTHATIYTDDRLALVDAIEGRDGAKVGAIDETMARGEDRGDRHPRTRQGHGDGDRLIVQNL